MKLFYYSLLDFSTVDFPGKIAAVVFTCGCNFRCGFCYNAELLKPQNCYSEEVSVLLKKIEEVREPLDGVVILGGEPLVQPEALRELIQGIKKMGLLVKLDTNGYLPHELEKVLPYVDYVAMDLKHEFEPEKYRQICGFPELDLERIKQSLVLLKKARPRVTVELRTTVIPGINDSEGTIRNIAQVAAQYGDWYVLQQFQPSRKVLDPKFAEIPATPHEHLLKLARLAAPLIKVKIRSDKGEEKITG